MFEYTGFLKTLSLAGQAALLAALSIRWVGCPTRTKPPFNLVRKRIGANLSVD